VDIPGGFDQQRQPCGNHLTMLQGLGFSVFDRFLSIPWANFLYNGIVANTCLMILKRLPSEVPEVEAGSSSLTHS